MNKHTPGPWKVGQYLGSHVHMDVGDRRGANVVDGVWERLANAQLIAAAPDLKKENERLREVNNELLKALDQIAVHIASVGYPRNKYGHYDKNGEWTFDEAIPKKADAAEIESALLLAESVIAKAKGGKP
jgi:hypothetical protein